MIAYVLVPFLWGFSEAVFFFIVPDVWLTSLVCLRGGKGIGRALGSALGGALLGGLCVYFAGLHGPSGIREFLDGIPGISQSMIEHAWQDLASKGEIAMVAGILKGIPYKIFAAGAGSLKMNLVLFLVVSLGVRSIRFLFSILVTLGICRFFEERIAAWKVLRIRILLLFWCVFYAFYFAHFGW